MKILREWFLKGIYKSQEKCLNWVVYLADDKNLVTQNDKQENSFNVSPNWNK